MFLQIVWLVPGLANGTSSEEIALHTKEYLHSVEKYLNSLAAKITDCSDHITIQEILSNTYNAELIPQEVLGTSYVSFANTEGMLIISGKQGVLMPGEYKDITQRTYFKVAKNNTLGKLRFATSELSLFKGGRVFPILMRFEDQNKISGYLVLGLRAHEFIKRIKTLAKLRPTEEFIVTNTDREILLASKTGDKRNNNIVQRVIVLDDLYVSLINN